MKRAPLLVLCALLGFGGCSLIFESDEASDPGQGLPDLLEPREESQLSFSHPEDCATCHEQHFQEWQITPHAYAAVDPVFRSMVKMGQAATEGKLGQFCIQCHSPSGLATGQTAVFYDEDKGVFDQELDLDPIAMTGVTCTACHSITNVIEPRNARIVYTPNGVMRGPIADPVDNDFHASEYNALFDDKTTDFGPLCGSCHNVVNPKGALIERTFEEFENSQVKAMGATCVSCHMPAYRGFAAEGPDAPTVPERELHRHTFVGVDVSLLPEGEFPGDQLMRDLAEELLWESVIFGTSYDPSSATLTTSIENLAGHAVPSGATAERQMWIELVVRDAAQSVVFESGTLDPLGDLRDGIAKHNSMPGTDPQLAYFGQVMVAITGFADMNDEEKAAARLEIEEDCISFGQGALRAGSIGTAVEMPWQADWQCDELVAADGTREHEYDLATLSPGSYTVTARLLFRSFPPFFLRLLEREAELSPDVKSRVPTMEMASTTLSIDVPALDL